jgi:acyl-CoA dehydrogenase
MTTATIDAASLSIRAGRVALEAAGPAAQDVDERSRFPKEALDAMRDERLLSAFVPTELGGDGATLSDVAEATFVLARSCGSTGMVFAMHHMQAACVVRHGRTPRLQDFLREMSDQQLLLASATTEAGIGGDIRTSSCAVEERDGRFALVKEAPVISYGAHADAVLATARRAPDSPPSDQVLVLCERPGLLLEERSGWDALGFRGTCSLGFTLTAEGDLGCILADPFADISAQTMLPVSHVLWGAVWLGIAAEAVDRARRFVQAAARKQPGVTPAGALRLAELMAVYQQMAELVRGAARRFDQSSEDREALSSLSFTAAMNSLKVSASTLVVDIVSRAMIVCGIAGYREDTPFSLGRLLRDAYGAAVQVNNDRILANTAQLLLVAREV